MSGLSFFIGILEKSFRFDKIVAMKALSTNRLAVSPYYARILSEYNGLLERDGKVNNLKFYREVILPVLPKYHLQSWYQFLRRFKTTVGLASLQVVHQAPNTISRDEENRLESTLLSSHIATQLGIQLALNIGAERLKELLENPQLMTTKDAIDLLFKAMKAQDSRMSVTAKIKQQSREQVAFDKVFSSAAYGEE